MGGVDYSVTFQTTEISTVLEVVQFITKMIYSFHMPLFMALSGALFYYTLRKPQVTLGLLIKAKAKRLLIPFIVVALLYSVPLKWISGYYANSRNIWKDIFIGQLCIQGNTHLWFLPTLFCIFILVFMIEKRAGGKNRFIIWLMLLFLFEISSKMPITLIQNIMQFGVWFYSGLCFEEFRLKVNTKVNGRVCFLTFSAFFLCFVIQSLLQIDTLILFKLISRGIKLCETLLGMSSVYTFSYLLSKTNMCKTEMFQTAKINSFGLYLYSDPLNYVLLSIAYLAVGNMIFTSNIYSGLFYVGRILLTTVIAWIVTEVLKKMRRKYLY